MKLAFKKITILILLPLLCLYFLSSISIKADGRIVRVGWFESNFNISDEYGRRSGYSYEYQQKLSVYTGWTYEYVSGSWSELLEMLIDGKIDLLSDVSNTDERKEKMIFSMSPMGSEDYYLYKSTTNTSISVDDYKTFNGKKIGVNKGSIMRAKFQEWALKNQVDAEIVELNASVDQALSMLKRGELDLYLNMDGSIDYDYATPLCKIGSSDFYFAVNKNLPELANELDNAMNKIFDSMPYYNKDLHSKYFKASGGNLYLSEEEKALIGEMGKIKIGYQDNYLAFCTKDSKTNELNGALKDYLNLASNSFKNGHVDFEPIAYPTAQSALDALKKGEIDCMFPANLSVYDGEKEGFFMTSPIIKTEIVAVVLESEQKSFIKKERVSVAVNSGNPNYDLFLVDNFPDWKPVYFDSTEECLKGINDGKADCLLISNYRFNNIASKCSDYKLAILSTGVELEYCFAVNRDDTILYSILNKIVNNIPESSVNSSISYYYTEDAKLGFGDYFNQYFGVIIAGLIIIALIILFLIFRIIFVDKKSKSRQKLIKATEIDAETGLYSKMFFIEYANKMYNENPDKRMDVIVIYIEHFHSISDINGSDFGSQLLTEVSDEIKIFIKSNGGISGYSTEGRFAVYTPHFDDYQGFFDRIQGRIDMISTYTNVKVRVGVSPYKEDIDLQESIKQAILACSMTMTEYKDYLIIFDEKMREKEERNQKLINDLSRAIDNKEFKIYYQPKYDISLDSPKIIGAEALLRWNHPELGIIEPNDFVPLFERNGEIVNIDKFVRSEVVKQIAIWKKKYDFVLPISVNISRMEVLEQAFIDSINLLMDEYNIEKNSLIFEINENSFIDNINQFVTAVNKLRNQGYRVELDDFGIGYSSLKMLSSLQVDAIKIDGSFIENLDVNEKNASLIKIILSLANNLNVPVIAEGVETEEELRVIKEIGIKIIQGFYLAKPLLETEFEEYVFKSDMR